MNIFKLSLAMVLVMGTATGSAQASQKMKICAGLGGVVTFGIGAAALRYAYNRARVAIACVKMFDKMSDASKPEADRQEAIEVSNRVLKRWSASPAYCSINDTGVLSQIAVLVGVAAGTLSTIGGLVAAANFYGSYRLFSSLKRA